MKVVLFLSSVLNSTIALAGAPDLVIDGISRVADSELQQVIAGYYRAEQEKDWPTTYSYRPSATRQIVPYSTYSREMTDALTGWQFLGVNVLDVAEQKDRYTNQPVTIVRIHFVESFVGSGSLEEFALKDLLPEGAWASGVLESEEETVWAKEGGQWKCLNCGRRFRVNMNFRMTY